MRFRQMDGLRAAAALAVVMIHVSAGQTTDAELVWNQLSRFAVPMFLVLTGFGHAGALTEGKFEPQGWTAVRRRLSRVLPPYFLWSAAYLVLEALCGTPHAHPLFDLLTGGAYVHLYYIFILVQFVLLADFFCIAMQRYPRRLMLCAAAATFGMQMLIACQANGMLMFHAPLSLVRLFFGWTLFYTGGIWLRLHEKWQRCLCERAGVAALSARRAADKPYVPLAQRILAAPRPSGLRLCDVAHAVDAVQSVPDASGARALYRPAFLRPVPRSSHGAAPVERLDDPSRPCHLPAPAADVSAGVRRRPRCGGAAVLPAFRYAARRRSPEKTIPNRRFINGKKEK